MTLMTTLPRVSRIRRYLLGVTAVLFLSLSAGVSGWFTQSVSAQTNTKEQAGKIISCTYYHDGVAYPGTCGVDKQDKTQYRCYSEADPSKSQPQIGCKARLEPSKGAKK